eukprot:scaffold17877_cov66-Phaeocystis_antarctica.AAC.4
MYPLEQPDLNSPVISSGKQITRSTCTGGHEWEMAWRATRVEGGAGAVHLARGRVAALRSRRALYKRRGVFAPHAAMSGSGGMMRGAEMRFVPK